MKNTYIIAEVSANHNNDIDIAIKTIEAIFKSGANAVKVQTYKPESLTLDLDTGFFSPRKEGLWKGFTPWDLYTEAAMPYEWQPLLQEKAKKLGLEFFSSPFDLEAVDFLESINVPRYKIASFEITDIPLIEYAASKRKPMIISTGLAEISDIELALEACRRVGNNDITLLKCTSQYPASIDQSNLTTILDMKRRFDVKVGLSDHTMGSLVPIVAVSLGATVIEKHFILDRSLGGPDAPFSMEPQEFKQMVNEIRNVERAIGNVSYQLTREDSLRRRSLFVTLDIEKGAYFTSDNIRSIRPGFGLHPIELNKIIGKKAKMNILKGTPITWDLVQFEEIG
jgi:pseudaminic acid synthase